MIYPAVIGSIGSRRAGPFLFNLLDGSISFAGTTASYLGVPNHTSLSIGTNSFTVEWWMKLDSSGSGSYPRIFSFGTWGSPTDIDFAVEISNKTTLAVWAQDTFQSFGAITQDEWGHYALVGDGSTIKVYKNGAQLGSTWNKVYDLSTTKNLVIGNETSPNATGVFKGLISNFQILKGVAKDYASLDAPLSPFYPVSDGTLSLLLLASDNLSTTTDSSSNAHSLTNTSSVAWSSDVPTLEDPMYQLSLSGAVEVSNTTYASGNDFVIGTNDFTIEWFQYLRAEDGYAFNYEASGGTDILTYRSQNTEEWNLYRPGVNPTTIGNFRNQLGRWVHLAIERFSNNLYYYQNGYMVMKRDMTYDMSDLGVLHVGNGGSGSTLALDGYISNFRVVNGSAVYSGTSFKASPPKTDLSAPANCVGLYKFASSGTTTTDSSGLGNTLYTFGGLTWYSFSKSMP